MQQLCIGSNGVRAALVIGRRFFGVCCVLCDVCRASSRVSCVACGVSRVMSKRLGGERRRSAGAGAITIAFRCRGGGRSSNDDGW
jgi:hypothetical protein